MLSIKSITSCNINGSPLFSHELSKRIFEYKKYIKENVHKDNVNINNNELNILCIQNLYGYRTGIIGYLSSLLSYKLSQYNNPTFFQRMINLFNYEVKSNDYEILSFITSFISRKIPIINISNWDLKQNLFGDNDIFKYEQSNLSMPSIFNLSSVYLLNPIFDSGCSLYSNIKPIESGFERWDISNNGEFTDKLFNKGINWSFFQSTNKKCGISIINISTINNVSEYIYGLQFKQIINLKEKLERKYALNLSCEKYETFILGDFNNDFNKTYESFDIKELWNIFEQSGLNIISSNENNFILHHLYSSTENKEQKLNKNTYMIYDDIITTINFEIEKNTDIDTETKNEKINDDTRPKDFYKVLSDIKNFYKKEKDVKLEEIKIEINYDHFNKNTQKSPGNSSEDEWQTI